MRVPGAAGLLLVVLAACAPAAPPAPSVQIVPDATGLLVAPTGLRVDFGRAPAGVIAALNRELGPHRVAALDGCPEGITQQLRWVDLVLTFTDERFVGWRQAERSAGTDCTGRLG